MKVPSKAMLRKFLEQLDLDIEDYDLSDADDLAEIYSEYTKLTTKPKKPKAKPKAKAKPKKPKTKRKPKKPEPAPTPEFPAPPTRKLIEVEALPLEEEELSLEDEERGDETQRPRASRLVDGAEIARNVYYVTPASLTGYLERNEEQETDLLMIAGNMNIERTNMVRKFELALLGNLQQRTPYDDPDDMGIGRFGIVIRTVKGISVVRDKADVIRDLAEVLSANMPADNYAVHIVDEGRNLSIRLSIGEYNEWTTWSLTGFDELVNAEAWFKQAFEDITDVTDAHDLAWFPFWEWDSEEVKDSPQL